MENKENREVRENREIKEIFNKCLSYLFLFFLVVPDFPVFPILNFPVPTFFPVFKKQGNRETLRSIDRSFIHNINAEK
jgi:hypothetical protein